MNSRTKLFLRWAPFVVLTGVSLWVASGLSRPRAPFYVDWSLSWTSLQASLGKVKHYESIALHFALALVAVGLRRSIVAFWLTIVVGLGWEIAESTAVGHHARLADLLPDTLAAVACLVMAKTAWSVVRSFAAKSVFHASAERTERK